MALKKHYTVGDLRFAPATAMQLCCKCSETFSATYGDYFMAPDDTVLKHCGRPVDIVTRRTVYQSVDPGV